MELQTGSEKQRSEISYYWIFEGRKAGALCSYFYSQNVVTNGEKECLKLIVDHCFGNTAVH